MIRPSDRRDSYRLHLDPGQAIVRMGGGRRIELSDLSASGGRLIVHGDGRPDLGAIEIELEGGGGFRARPDVVRMRSHRPGVYHLGARFAGLGPDDVHELSRFLTREFQRRTSDPARLLDPERALRVKSPLFIRNLFGARDAAPLDLEVIDRSLRLGARLRVDAVQFEEGRRVIRARFLGDVVEPLAADRTYEFLLGGAAAVTVFEARCLGQDGGAVTLTLPEEVRQTGSRLSPRIDLDLTAARIASPHPRLPDALEGPILDAANRGLSFAVAETGHGLFPGDRLTRLRIELPARTLEARAVVRSLAAGPRPGTATCGVELLTFATRAQSDAWRAFVFDRLHPSIRDGNGRAETAWDLLEGSKYVELWTPPAARANARREYVRSWQAAPADIGHSVLMYRQRAVGMVAGSVVTPRSWVLHHLACDARGDGDARTPLASSFEVISAILHRLQAETDLEHFLIYIERGKRWNERLYGDFAARYFDQEKIEIRPIEVYRRSTAVALPEIGLGVEVVGPSATLVAQLGERLAATTTALERKALALDEDGLDLRAFSEQYRRSGQERERDLFFALEGGRAKAALIADSGGEGVNIFGLLNTCRIVGLDDEAPSPVVRHALLRRAVEHYRAEGKLHFLLFEESEVDDAPARLGYERVSGGLRWIAHRDVIPAWAAYLEGLLASGAAS